MTIVRALRRRQRPRRWLRVFDPFYYLRRYSYFVNGRPPPACPTRQVESADRLINKPLREKKPLHANRDDAFPMVSRDLRLIKIQGGARGTEAKIRRPVTDIGRVL